MIGPSHIGPGPIGQPPGGLVARGPSNRGMEIRGPNGPPPPVNRNELKELGHLDFEFIKPYLKKYWWPILRVILLNLVVTLTNIIPPLIM